MAARYLNLYGPALESTYAPTPLDFINERITQDQKDFDTGLSTLSTAQSNLKQEVAPWNVGKETELLNKYQTRLKELTDQYYKLGEPNRVIPQIAAVAQEWQNDPTRKYLQSGYDWYKNVLEPKIKSGSGNEYIDLYNYDYDPQTGAAVPKGWREDIDNYALDKSRFIKDNSQEFINREVMKASPSLQTFITEAGGRENVQQDALGYYYTDPSTSTIKRLDYKNAYTVGARDAIANNILTNASDDALYIREMNNIRSLEDARKYVDNFLVPRFYKEQTIHPGDTHNISLPDGSGGSGSGLSIDKSADTFHIDPVGVSITDYDYGSTQQNISKLNLQKEKLENEAIGVFAEAVKDPSMTGIQNVLNTMETMVDSKLDVLIGNEKDNTKKTALTNVKNADTVKTYILANPVEAFKEGGVVEQYMGKEGKQELKNTMYTEMLNVWQGSPENSPEAVASNRYMEAYHQAQKIEFQKDRLESINNAIAEGAASDYDFGKLGKEKTFDIMNNWNSFETWFDQNKKPLGGQFGGAAGDYGIGPIMPESKRKDVGYSNVFTYVPDDLFKQWSDAGIISKNSDPSNAVMLQKGSDKMYVDYYNVPTLNSRVDNNAFRVTAEYKSHIKDKLDDGSLTINQNKVITETTQTEKDRGAMGNFQKSLIGPEGVWSKDSGKLKGAIDKYVSNLADGDEKNRLSKNNLYQIFNGSIMRSKNFKASQDGDIELSGVSFETDPRTSTPLMYVTAKDKKGNYSTISLDLSQYDKESAKDMMLQMITDDKDNVRAVGSQWFASLSTDDDSLGAISMYFESGAHNLKKESEIKFTSGQGSLKKEFVLKNIGNGATQLGTYENGIFKAVEGGYNSEGKWISGQDIDNYVDVLQMVGFYQLGNAQYRNNQQTNSDYYNSGVYGGGSEGKYQNPFK